MHSKMQRGALPSGGEADQGPSLWDCNVQQRG